MRTVRQVDGQRRRRAETFVLDVFELVKQSVSITDAARRYGLDINSRGKAHCCFHSPDKHPSMSFKGGRFKCFSCDEGGDVIKLVQHLLSLTQPIDAVKRLNADYSLGLDIGVETDPLAARRWRAEQIRLAAFNDWIDTACRVWAAYCRQLWAWKRDCAPASPDEPFDQRFVDACYKIDYADYIFQTVFIDGDFAAQAQFYKTHKEEVEALGRNQSGQAGAA